MDDFVMQLDVNSDFDSYLNSQVNKVAAVSTHPKHTQGVVLLDGNEVIKPFTCRFGRLKFSGDGHLSQLYPANYFIKLCIQV